MASQAIAKREQLAGIRTLLENRTGELDKAVPAGLVAERLTRIALTTIANGHTSLIAACHNNQASLWASVLEASQLGLTLDGPLGQAYLVPRKGKVQMQVGYKGLVALAVRGGVVSHVSAEVVREGDFFQYETGSSAYLRHVPPDKGQKRGMPTHVYAVAYLVRGGPPPFVVLTKDEVEEYRKLSSANTERGDSPWVAHWQAMAKKTAIRRLCDGSRFPLTADERRAAATDAGRPEAMVLPAQARVDHETPEEDYDPETGEVRGALEADFSRAKSEPGEPPHPADAVVDQHGDRVVGAEG